MIRLGGSLDLSFQMFTHLGRFQSFSIKSKVSQTFNLSFLCSAFHLTIFCRNCVPLLQNCVPLPPTNQIFNLNILLQHIIQRERETAKHRTNILLLANSSHPNIYKDRINYPLHVKRHANSEIFIRKYLITYFSSKCF